MPSIDPTPALQCTNWGAVVIVHVNMESLFLRLAHEAQLPSLVAGNVC